MAAFAIAVAVMGLTVAVTMPVSHADVLPMGTTCPARRPMIWGGVHDWRLPAGLRGHAGDVVHTRSTPPAERDRKVVRRDRQTVNMSSGFNYAVQGCRKST